MNTVYKTFFSICVLILLSGYAKAQKGPFIKVSIGSGFTTEFTGINNYGHSMVNKNHAVGWGITDDFALQIGEFGSLNKIKTEDDNYINTDAFGVGFSYRISSGIKISSLLAYSLTSFEKKWWETEGEVRGKGFGINMSIDKEWLISQRWSFHLGPQIYWIKTKDLDYEFFNISLNASIVFHLNPLTK